MFYDLDDPEMMYELDRRHRHWLKANGVIRQGVLWRKEELLAWFDKYVRACRKLRQGFALTSSYSSKYADILTFNTMPVCTRWF